MAQFIAGVIVTLGAAGQALVLLAFPEAIRDQYLGAGPVAWIALLAELALFMIAFWLLWSGGAEFWLRVARWRSAGRDVSHSPSARSR
jgi:hypothetical protein